MTNARILDRIRDALPASRGEDRQKLLHIQGEICPAGIQARIERAQKEAEEFGADSSDAEFFRKTAEDVKPLIEVAEMILRRYEKKGAAA